MISRGAVGVVSGVAFFGQDVQASEQAEGLVKVEITDVAAAFFVEQFQSQQAQQSGDSRHLAGTRIAGLGDESVHAQTGQQR